MKTFSNRILDKLLSKELHNEPLLIKALILLLTIPVMLLTLIFAVLLLLIMLIVFLELLQAIAYALKWLFESAPTYAHISVLWGIVIVGFIVNKKYFNRKRHQYSPIFRLLYNRLPDYYPLYNLSVVTILLICKFNDIIEPAYSQTFMSKITGIIGMDGYLFGEIHPIKVGLVAIALINFRLVSDIRETVYHVTIPRNKYNLYLRSFFMDQTVKIDAAIRDNFGGELVEIADPATEYGNQQFSGMSLFLSTNDWKRELKYYIKKANIVFCCIGTGEGILWEMFDHNQEIEKYVCYVDDQVSLSKILQSVSAKRFNSMMGLAIKRLIEIDYEKPFFFIIRGRICYYSKSLTHIADFLSTGNSSEELKQFEIDILPSKTTGKVLNFETYHHFKDLQRILSMLFRPMSFNTFYRTIYRTICRAFMLLIRIVGVFMILWAICDLLSIAFPVLDFFEINSIWKKLLGGLLGTICGFSLLFNDFRD